MTALCRLRCLLFLPPSSCGQCSGRASERRCRLPGTSHVPAWSRPGLFVSLLSNRESGSGKRRGPRGFYLPRMLRLARAQLLRRALGYQNRREQKTPSMDVSRPIRRPAEGCADVLSYQECGLQGAAAARPRPCQNQQKARLHQQIFCWETWRGSKAWLPGAVRQRDACGGHGSNLALQPPWTAGEDAIDSVPAPTVDVTLLFSCSLNFGLLVTVGCLMT